MYLIYWLISQRRDKTYIGYSDDLKRRKKEHRDKKVKSTINFGDFKCYILEKVNTIQEARRREKYWKSAAGRRKLKKLFGHLDKKRN